MSSLYINCCIFLFELRRLSFCHLKVVRITNLNHAKLGELDSELWSGEFPFGRAGLKSPGAEGFLPRHHRNKPGHPPHSPSSLGAPEWKPPCPKQAAVACPALTLDQPWGLGGRPGMWGLRESDSVPQEQLSLPDPTHLISCDRNPGLFLRMFQLRIPPYKCKGNAGSGPEPTLQGEPPLRSPKHPPQHPCCCPVLPWGVLREAWLPPPPEVGNAQDCGHCRPLPQPLPFQCSLYGGP